MKNKIIKIIKEWWETNPDRHLDINRLLSKIDKIDKKPLSNCSFCHPESICKKHKIEQQNIITELSAELE